MKPELSTGRELPRRVLGAVLSVLVPGAGHVVLGHHRIGWIVAAVSLLLGGAIVASAMTCAITAFLVFGAAYIFGTVMSVLSIFALPPGPRLAAGLKALWPVLVLFLVFRGAGYLVQTYALEADIAPDAAMRTAIESGDIVLASLQPGSSQPGQVLVVEHPAGSGKRALRRVSAVDGDSIALKADDPTVASELPARVNRAQVHARALFVFAAARGTNGQGRVWKRLGP